MAAYGLAPAQASVWQKNGADSVNHKPSFYDSANALGC